MSTERLTHKVFTWDKTKRGWCKDIKLLMAQIDCSDCFDLDGTIDLIHARTQLHSNYCDTWKTEVVNYPKLRTYITYKQEYCTELYVTLVNNRSHRSALAQFRSGILPLSVETGRFNNIPLEYRLCIFCDSNHLEDETHFLFHCSFYNNLRIELFTQATSMCLDFPNMSNTEKLYFLMSRDIVKQTAKYIFLAFSKRRLTLYR